MSFWGWVAQLLQNYWPMFVRGAGITLLISIVGTIIGFIIGLLTGVVRTIPIPENAKIIKKIGFKIINALIGIYVAIFRGTPMIVQAMVIYYGAGTLFNIHLNNIIAGIFIVSINTGAYMTEIVRGGIISIDKGQFEGAHAIGMTHWQTMRHVVIPQVIRNILPATGNEFVINIKDTSVLNVISVTELFFNTKSIAGNNFRYFEAYLITSVIYLIMTLTVTKILSQIERKMDGPKDYVIQLENKSVEEAK